MLNTWFQDKVTTTTTLVFFLFFIRKRFA